MKKAWAVLLLLLLGCLCACGQGSGAPAASPAPSLTPPPGPESSPAPAPTPEPAPIPEPTPEPTPDPAPTPILTQIRLVNDPLPEGYRLLDYAACSNSTLDSQTYIDTGLSPTNKTRFYLDFQCTTGFQTKDTWFFGCFDRSRHMFMELGYHASQGNTAMFYTTCGAHYSQTEDSALRTVAWLRPGDYHCPDYKLGKTYYFFDEPVKQHLYLFSRQHMDMSIAGTHDTEGRYDLRIYECRIWDDGVLLRDYVPCLRLSDGRTGMYDLVEDRACFSDGSEELLPGPEVLEEMTITARDGEIRRWVLPPSRAGFVFRGYYTGPRGSGEQILNARGKPVAPVPAEDEITLYAFWTRDEEYFDRY